ncbi:cytochrome P450 82A3-like [Vigna umbellata]|uniref:cytochrome P450 82A3-like n=1 Tax=Vigna umbellata TaxID=87088 RepID=UPI001F5F5770|nr:cytochrome P450 82A3-like [Vigna umbellata]
MDLFLVSNLNTTAFALFSLTLLLAFSLFRFRPSKAGSNLPEPPMASGAWPILGHLMLLGGSPTPHKTLAAMADKYGPLFTIKLGSRRALVLSNWKMAKECYTTNDVVVSSRSKLVAIEHVAYNQASFGFAPYGPYWREIRKIVTVFLSDRKTELLTRVRVSEIRSSVKELFHVWSEKKGSDECVVVEMKQWFTELVFNIVFQTMAGKRLFGKTAVVSEKDAEKCVKALREFMQMLGVCTVADAVPVLRWMNLGVKAMKETAKELDVILDEWLVEHSKKRALFGEKGVESDDQDFMDTMLSVLEGATIDGFDAATINKATTLKNYTLRAPYKTKGKCLFDNNILPTF